MSYFLTGAYTGDGGGEADGIGFLGDSGFLGTLWNVASPSWLAVRGDRLYAVGEGAGTVHSWRFEGGTAGGGVLHEDPFVRAGGEIPCHLSVLPDALLVSCYGDGVLTRVPLDASGAVGGDGEVILRGEGSGPHPDQTRSRIHSTLVLPDGTVLAADLGTDVLHVLTTDGGVRSWAVPPGTGPRDLARLDDGRILVLGELSCSLLVLDAEGTVLSATRLPGADDDDHAAALALRQRGDVVRVYSGLRGSDLVAVVDVPASGAPVPVASARSAGEWPRHLVVDDEVIRVANQLSSTVTVLDAETLAHDGRPQAVPSPAQLVPVPDEWVALVE